MNNDSPTPSEAAAVQGLLDGIERDGIWRGEPLSLGPLETPARRIMTFLPDRVPLSARWTSPWSQDFVEAVQPASTYTQESSSPHGNESSELYGSGFSDPMRGHPGGHSGYMTTFTQSLLAQRGEGGSGRQTYYVGWLGNQGDAYQPGTPTPTPPASISPVPMSPAQNSPAENSPAPAALTQDSPPSLSSAPIPNAGVSPTPAVHCPVARTSLIVHPGNVRVATEERPCPPAGDGSAPALLRSPAPIPAILRTPVAFREGLPEHPTTAELRQYRWVGKSSLFRDLQSVANAAEVERRYWADRQRVGEYQGESEQDAPTVDRPTVLGRPCKADFGPGEEEATGRSVETDVEEQSSEEQLALIWQLMWED